MKTLKEKLFIKHGRILSDIETKEIRQVIFAIAPLPQRGYRSPSKPASVMLSVPLVRYFRTKLHAFLDAIESFINHKVFKRLSRERSIFLQHERRPGPITTLEMYFLQLSVLMIVRLSYIASTSHPVLFIVIVIII